MCKAECEIRSEIDGEQAWIVEFSSQLKCVPGCWHERSYQDDGSAIHLAHSNIMKRSRTGDGGHFNFVTL